MFKEGKTYRHTSTLDMDVYVVKLWVESIDNTCMLVRYYNRYMNIFQGKPESVTILAKDYWKWKEVVK